MRATLYIPSLPNPARFHLSDPITRTRAEDNPIEQPRPIAATLPTWPLPAVHSCWRRSGPSSSASISRYTITLWAEAAWLSGRASRSQPLAFLPKPPDNATMHPRKAWAPPRFPASGEPCSPSCQFQGGRHARLLPHPPPFLQVGRHESRTAIEIAARP